MEFSELFKGTLNLLYVNYQPTGFAILWIIVEKILTIIWKITCVLHKVDVLTDFPKLWFVNMKSVESLKNKF